MFFHSRKLAKRILEASKHPDSSKQQDVISGLGADLVCCLLDSQMPDGLASKPGRAWQRRRIRLRAIEIMRLKARDSLSMGELCQKLGVSWRQLDYAFKEHFGLAPKAYYNRLRLQGLREDLLKAGPGSTVTQLAGNWGFTHFGQLSVDYRNLFGDNPSTTLKQH